MRKGAAVWIIVAAALVASCSDGEREQTAGVTNSSNSANVNVAASKPPAAPAPTPKPTREPSVLPSPIASDDITEAEPDPPEMCWQDYCPCEESGPPDRVLCRNLRGGVAVSKEEMAAGAAARDARKSIDDWNRDNPGGFDR